MNVFTYTLGLLFIAAGQLTAQSFDDFLLKLQAAPAGKQQFMADSFVATLSATPVVYGDSRCHFIYQGQGLTVSIAGDHNGWSDSKSPLARIPNTNLWFRSETFEADARLDYKIVVDQNWILDPGNPRTISGGFGPNSELRMPGYLEPLELVSQTNIARGRFVDTIFTSAELHNVRDVRIYLPAGYDLEQRDYPMVLFHDGLDYIRLGAAGTVLDNLIANGTIPPVIAVFVPAVNRTEEYAGASIDAFTRFIVGELLPAIDARYRTSKDPRYRAVMGSSNGGNISLYLGMLHPGIFGNVGAQSSNIIGAIAQRFNQMPALPLRLYIDVGTYDIPILIPMARSFVSTLQQNNYAVQYREFHEGHSWGSWRAHVDNALVYFFASLMDIPAQQQPLAATIELTAVWPNPAASLLHVQLRCEQSVELHADLYDTLGRHALSVMHGKLTAGNSTLNVDTGHLPRGIYHLRVSAAGLTRIRTIKLY